MISQHEEVLPLGIASFESLLKTAEAGPGLEQSDVLSPPPGSMRNLALFSAMYLLWHLSKRVVGDP